MTDKYCSNCGQQVQGETAKASTNPETKFCCECGRALENGKCVKYGCKFYGEVPDCADH